MTNYATDVIGKEEGEKGLCMASIFGHDSQPVDAEVTILFRSPEEVPVSPSASCRLDTCISQAQVVLPTLDPIRLRGVGATTL